MSDYGYQPRSSMTDSTVPLHVRIRNEHSHTLAAGWRLSSSTVEITFTLEDMGAKEARESLEDLQRLAFEAGQNEAVRRNQEGAH